MMIEEKFMAAMINAEQRGAYFIAANYGLIHARFVGVKELPARPMTVKTHDEFVDQWCKYYFQILEVIGKQAQQTLIEVREKYGKKGKGLPQRSTD